MTNSGRHRAAVGKLKDESPYRTSLHSDTAALKGWQLDSTQILIALLITTWVAGGAAVAVVMRRSGHEFGLWLTLGILLGPFSAFFAQERHRLDMRQGIGRIREFRAGPFDALAGIDGSEESITAVRTALSLLGQTLNSLTLVTALDYEASGSFTGITSQSHAYSQLADVA